MADYNFLSQGYQAPPAPANPLIALGQAQGIQNAQATNAYMQQATKNAGIQGQTMQMEQGMAGSNRAASTMAALLHLPQGQLTPQVMQQALDKDNASGALPPQAYQAASAAIKAAPNEMALRQMAFHGLIAGMPAIQQLAQTFGDTASMSNGQENQPGVVTSPAATAMGAPGGFHPQGAAVPIYPSRAELANRTQIGVDAKGAPVYAPIANVTPDNLAGPAGSPFGDGRGGSLPPALRNPNSPKVSGVTTNGIGPAAESAMAGQGADSQKAFQEISAQGVAARSQDAILQNMQNDAAQFTTGSAQDRVKSFNVALVSWAPKIAAAFGVDPKTVAANESFDKLAAQISNAQGAGSDARLSVTQAANPSSHLSPEGVDLILRQLRGNADYLKARAALASQYPDQTNNRGFEADVASHLDPRAFQYARMTPQQRATYFNSIKSAADKASLKSSYIWAEGHSLIGAPNGG